MHQVFTSFYEEMASKHGTIKTISVENLRKVGEKQIGLLAKEIQETVGQIAVGKNYDGVPQAPKGVVHLFRDFLENSLERKIVGHLHSILNSARYASIKSAIYHKHKLMMDMYVTALREYVEEHPKRVDLLAVLDGIEKKTDISPVDDEDMFELCKIAGCTLLMPVSVLYEPTNASYMHAIIQSIARNVNGMMLNSKRKDDDPKRKKKSLRKKAVFDDSDDESEYDSDDESEDASVSGSSTVSNGDTSDEEEEEEPVKKRKRSKAVKRSPRKKPKTSPKSSKAKVESDEDEAEDEEGEGADSDETAD